MSWRAVIIGTVAVALLSAFTPYNDLARNNTFLTGNYFPIGAFFLLVSVTVGLNTLVKLVRRRLALRSAELMLIWCMLLVSSSVPCTGLMRYFFPMLASPPSYAQRQDITWEETIWQDIPDGLVLSKEVGAVAATHFYLGPAPGQEPVIPWRRWAGPVVRWLIFVWLYYLASFFMCSLLRRQWVERERLMFPLMQVPLELTAESESSGVLPPLFRRRLFWYGVLTAVAVDLWRVHPVLLGTGGPVNIAVPIGAALAETEWQHALFSDAIVFPTAVGFIFLVPAHVSFSLWFFWVLARLELQLGYALGTPLGAEYSPFMAWQQAGTVIALVGGIAWLARSHLADVVRKALGLKGAVDDSSEPVSYRVSFWGLLVAFAGLIAWSVYHGVPPFMAAGVLALMLATSLVHARTVAQGGLFHVMQHWSPVSVLHSLTGGAGFGGQGMVVAMMQHNLLGWDNYHMFGPDAMHALKASDVLGRRRRMFIWVVILALAVAMAFGAWSNLRVHYSIGAANLGDASSTRNRPVWTFQDAQQNILDPEGTSRPQFLAMGIGVVATTLTMVCHARYAWWPLHPLGLVTAASYALRGLWFSTFLAWLAKTLIARFGGGRLLRRARTFFLGAVVGGTLFVAAMALVSLSTGRGLGIYFLP